jgi:hypothetical protein
MAQLTTPYQTDLSHREQHMPALMLLESITALICMCICCQLLLQYRNPWGFLRMGRLLEDLDSLAGSIAFSHW